MTWLSVRSHKEPYSLHRDPDAIDIVGDGILASFPLQHSRTVIRREPHQRENQEICKGVTIGGRGLHIRNMDDKIIPLGFVSSVFLNSTSKYTCRQGTSADGVQDGRKLNKSFPTQDQDVVEAKSAQKESQENAKNVDTLRSGIHTPDILLMSSYTIFNCNFVQEPTLI